MIKIERKETEKTKQAIADLQKASENESSYKRNISWKMLYLRK